LLGTLYAYTPEVLPSAHRATGNGIAIACNRVMGLVSAAVASSANTATSAPIYICAVLYIVMVSEVLMLMAQTLIKPGYRRGHYAIRAIR